MLNHRDEEEEEIVPIPLDRATRARLVAFARATGLHPREAASALLRDLLEDDERLHRLN